jgi:hypothetical protein
MTKLVAENPRVSLDVISIASPCPASWEGMTGDQRIRYCEQCRKKVYNIAEMSKDEAESFLSDQVGSVCVRLFRRSDGTILTRDCPIGVRAIRRGIASALMALAGMAGIFVAIVWWRFGRASATQTPIQQRNKAANIDLNSELPLIEASTVIQSSPDTGPLERLVNWLDPPTEVWWMIGTIDGPSNSPPP